MLRRGEFKAKPFAVKMKENEFFFVYSNVHVTRRRRAFVLYCSEKHVFPFPFDFPESGYACDFLDGRPLNRLFFNNVTTISQLKLKNRFVNCNLF